MRSVNIGILGATGVVGRQMMQVIEERSLPVGELRLLSSARSAGSKVLFKGRELTVREAKEGAFDGLDFVLGAVSSGLSRVFAPEIKKSGAVFVDNSSAFRMDDSVPLVVPEINPEDAFRHNGIIANPNCSTIITLVAINGIRKLSPIETMVAATYQAVSGAGHEGMEELERQMKDPDSPPKVFPCRIAANVIPMIGSELENGYTAEEMKMQNEGRKIMHLPDLKVCCTCVRVPVVRSHSIAVQMVTRDPITVEQAKQAIAAAPGCVLAQDLDGRDYPTPIDTTSQDLVYVGRVRRDLIDDRRGLALWCCGDQIRKGAATNAVQIIQLLLDRN